MEKGLAGARGQPRRKFHLLLLVLEKVRWKLFLTITHHTLRLVPQLSSRGRYKMHVVVSIQLTLILKWTEVCKEIPRD